MPFCEVVNRDVAVVGKGREAEADCEYCQRMTGGPACRKKLGLPPLTPRSLLRKMAGAFLRFTYESAGGIARPPWWCDMCEYPEPPIRRKLGEIKAKCRALNELDKQHID